MSQKRTYKQYTKEFKEEAVALVREGADKLRKIEATFSGAQCLGVLVQKSAQPRNR